MLKLLVERNIPFRGSGDSARIDWITNRGGAREKFAHLEYELDIILKENEDLEEYLSRWRGRSDLTTMKIEAEYLLKMLKIYQIGRTKNV